MSYQVFWIPTAQQELAAVWLAASDRNAVRMAAHRLEQQLRRNPLHTGESRDSPTQRVAFDAPLGIEFEIIEDDKKVRVLGVWLTE